MKMMNFNSVRDKVAIVTGASRGIGRAIAECFGENGMKVVCAARSAEQGQAVADGICAKGGDAIFIQTDCSKASAIKELVDKTVAHYGKLDGVVSNAGIGMGGTPLHEYEVEDYEKIFSLNSEGVFAGMKYGAEAILKSHSEGGYLINVASVAGLVPQRGQALYSATKFGVVGMTRAAALDYAMVSPSTPSAPVTPRPASSVMHRLRPWTFLHPTARQSGWATRRSAPHWHFSLPAVWHGTSPVQPSRWTVHCLPGTRASAAGSTRKF